MGLRFNVSGVRDGDSICPFGIVIVWELGIFGVPMFTEYTAWVSRFVVSHSLWSGEKIQNSTLDVRRCSKSWSFDAAICARSCM